ncbi:MAG TPA: hypothetical protein PKM20_06365 [Nitrosomonas sp.]|uniref:hypothetical protein n=1 Tax=Nitrosomonas sp. TaxID=42353 RepID=UPI000E7F75FF|nr:hypothetical protein [Nitrosomonas sp.]GJL74191.1 MAG: hypothetical protein NMNS02_02970 [Nitrosomonas sp.]HBV20914.1 hypothetical protein [Nitrosomonas sp.]HNP26343.1 hypothetical protein [Nitrosomonas sp.]
MQQSVKNIRHILIYAATVSLISLIYFIYAYSVHSIPEARETFLSEIGEGFGKAGLGLLAFIYFRTFMKLVLGQGKLAQRLLPDYVPPVNSSVLNRLLVWMNRTHVYFGIAAIALILLHISLMGFSRYSHILFFPALLTLVIWQGLFGLFLTWRYSPAELKKFSHVVHAQFVTGIAIGIFAFFGHILIDD